MLPMDLTPYIDSLRRELALAADAGGDDARALAERLTAPLESATRLALLDALSAAAAEITRDLAPGSVDVRLRGRDPDFVVTPPPSDQPFEEAERPAGHAGSGMVVVLPPASDEEDGGTSRITLRLPEHLKPKIEDAAGQAGLSVNAWLVRVAAAALTPSAAGNADDSSRRAAPPVGKRYTGWVR